MAANGEPAEPGAEFRPYPYILPVWQELDRRGILHSVVSQASGMAAQKALEEAGLWPLLIKPQFNAGSKARAVAATLEALNLLPQHAAFVDDDPFHRAEVAELVPGVLTIPAEEAAGLVHHPRLMVTSSLGPARRRMLQDEERREEARLAMGGDRRSFLLSCRMQLACRPAGPADGERAFELLKRAHRLNANPHPHSTTALPVRSALAEDRMWVGCLSDRFGDYGLVAVAVVIPGADEEVAFCRELAFSCRVKGRGVTEAFLYWLVNKHLPLELAIRICTQDEVNKPLRTTLRLLGFAGTEKSLQEEELRLRHPSRLTRPEWITILDEDC
ncbi:MAG TPA: hypothetical protein GXX29_06500 [Firmicutes bacterium]|nr:hypothetical protein [Bacillota bacterium]